MSHSTPKAGRSKSASDRSEKLHWSDRPDRPNLPFKDFPLFPHPTGNWAKKIRGKLHYFGPWRDPDGALQKYLDQRDDLHAGRTPRVKADGFTIRDLSNRFLTAKKNQRDAGDITARTFADYCSTCKQFPCRIHGPLPTSAISD